VSGSSTGASGGGDAAAADVSGLEVALRASVGAFRLDVAFRSNAAVTALVGPSGAGKSLTLRALAGLLRGVDGRVVVDGAVWLDAAAGVDLPARARRVGVLFQGLALFPHLDVAGNIGFGLTGPGKAARVAELAERVELGDRLSARVGDLSGGQQQRVALARALAPRPALLLLDEPFSSVDADLRERLRRQVAEVVAAEGVRTVLVTHDPADVAALAGAVVRVVGGRVA
jgi:molybdate transport system ATP-binding protein